MTRSRVRDHYQRSDQSGDEYLRRRFRSPGGQAVSDLELEPFRRWLDLAPGERLLDCASGTGRVLSAIAPERRRQATAMDASAPMLDHLRREYPEVRAIQGDLFPFEPGERFDVVTALRVLDHFNLADQEILLRRFRGFLKPGGRIVVSLLVGPTLESLANKLSRAGGMNFFHSRGSYRRMFRRCGLRAARTFDAFVLPRGLTYRLPAALVRPVLRFERWAGRILHPLCSYMTVELRRDE